MLTQLNIIQDQRGYTVAASTTHQTYAGALAHFTELLTQFTHDHCHAAASRAAQAAGDTPTYYRTSAWFSAPSKRSRSKARSRRYG